MRGVPTYFVFPQPWSGSYYTLCALLIANTYNFSKARIVAPWWWLWNPETCRSIFHVNIDVNFDIFRAVYFCISWINKGLCSRSKCLYSVCWRVQTYWRHISCSLFKYFSNWSFKIYVGYIQLQPPSNRVHFLANISHLVNKLHVLRKLKCRHLVRKFRQFYLSWARWIQFIILLPVL
jgi:hypothetical protein